MNHNKSYYAYILKCEGGSYYVGSTDNPEQRLSIHNAGRGPKWTALRLPVELVHCEKFETQKKAIQRENQIKRWSRAEKEALIAGNIDALKRLSKRKTK
jgi:putative endonuclease